MNSNENDLTIASYEDNADRYANATRNDIGGMLKRWLDSSVEGLLENVSIFEIGSGTGRDALYLQSKGYTVQCSDATDAFLVQLAENGLNAKHFNVIKDIFSSSYDLILADAVLLHLNREQFKHALLKIRSALRDNGRLAFTVKEGEGEAWSDKKIGKPRYFCYWSERDIRGELERAGFSKVTLFKGGESGGEWLNIVAQAA